ncbi:MAG: alpha/beta hydrolase [Turneriella sp.]|nr:alpha/beta hydrolase [Turneriella sp.]
MYDYNRYPAPTGYFKTGDGVMLPYFSYGKADAEHTILFLNGFTCNQFNIAKVIGHLAGDFHIVTFDYRGQGLAYREAYPKVSVEAALADIDAFHAHLGRPEVLLFGYSMGCQLAVEWNYQNSQYVKGMVLLLGIYGNIFNTFLNLGIFAPLVKITHELFPFFQRFYRLAWRSAHSLPYPLRVTLGRGALLNPELVGEHELRPFLDQLADLDFEYIIRMSHAIHHHSNEGQYHKIDVPLLVISGENDLFALPIHSERVHQAVQGSWYFAIPRGTHNAILENAGDIHTWVREFLTAKNFLAAP